MFTDVSISKPVLVIRRTCINWHLCNLTGGNAGTVSTYASLTATVGNSLDFTCYYILGTNEVVYPGLIRWEIKKGSGFEAIATFSHLGGVNAFTTTESGQKFRNRSELLNVTLVGSNTFAVVMRVTEVYCSDEDIYRCSVTFFSQGQGLASLTAETSITVRGKWYISKQQYINQSINPSIHQSINQSINQSTNQHSVLRMPEKIWECITFLYAFGVIKNIMLKYIILQLQRSSLMKFRFLFPITISRRVWV
jgi:hypothetical protein